MRMTVPIVAANSVLSFVKRLDKCHFARLYLYWTYVKSLTYVVITELIVKKSLQDRELVFQALKTFYQKGTR